LAHAVGGVLGYHDLFWRRSRDPAFEYRGGLKWAHFVARKRIGKTGGIIRTPLGQALASGGLVRAENGTATNLCGVSAESTYRLCKKWPAPNKQVPTLFLTSFDKDWAAEVNQITVTEKKKMFFASVEPLVLEVNRRVLLERSAIKSLKADYENQSWNNSKQDRLNSYKKKYRVTANNNSEVLAELLVRVDVLPVSLVLAQGAIESDWGTSRFTIQGNALFGQWTWGDDAMKPKQQRAELGNYGIKPFSTLEESIEAYYLNVNSHNAYKVLRMIRAQNSEVNGTKLAEGLINYSEEGMKYVRLVQSVIRVNKLEQTNNDKLVNQLNGVYVSPSLAYKK